MEIEKPTVIDILDTPGTPALSSTSDMPVIETKPDVIVPAAAPEKDAELPEESATSATEETEVSEQSGEPAKKESRGVQKALDRLAAEREEQRRRAEAAEEREKQLLESLKKPEEPKAEPIELKRPSRQDYQDDDSYAAALDTYVDERASLVARNTLAQERAELERRAQEEAIRNQAQAAQDVYNERKAKAKEKYADYEQVAEQKDVQVSMPVAHAILQSEQGPELQYYLGQNPDEAKRLLGLPVTAQLMELGVIATKLASPVQATPKPPISSAPAPIKPTRASNAAPVKNPEDMTMDEFAVYYKKLDSERARH